MSFLEKKEPDGIFCAFAIKIKKGGTELLKDSVPPKFFKTGFAVEQIPNMELKTMCEVAIIIWKFFSCPYGFQRFV